MRSTIGTTVFFTQGVKGDYLMLPAAKELHAKECKDNDEEEEEEDEGDDGLHGVHQRDDQVSQRRPVPWQSQDNHISVNISFKVWKMLHKYT